MEVVKAAPRQAQLLRLEGRVIDDQDVGAAEEGRKPLAVPVVGKVQADAQLVDV